MTKVNMSGTIGYTSFDYNIFDLSHPPPYAEASARQAKGEVKEKKMTTSRDQPLKGIGFYSVSVLLFSVLGAIVRHLNSAAGVYEMVFVRSIVIVIIMLGVLGWKDQFRLLKTTRIKAHILRSSVGLVALTTVTWAYTLLPLSEVTVISFTTPFFIAILSAPALGEKVSRDQWIAIIMGFIGVTIAFFPSLTTLKWGIVVALTSALCQSLVSIFLRDMGKTEASETIVFYFALLCTAASAVCFMWLPFTLGVYEIVMLLLAGVAAYFAQMGLTLAFRYCPAAMLGPFQYVGIIWAALIGYLFFDDVPSWYLVGGSVFVIGSGLYMLNRTTRQQS